MKLVTSFPATQFHANCVDAVARATQKLGYSHMNAVSGAGHETDKDEGPSVADIAGKIKALKAANKQYEAHIYPNVNHGFHNDTTPRYDKKAAELWLRSAIPSAESPPGSGTGTSLVVVVVVVVLFCA